MIASGYRDNVLVDILKGCDVGTYIHPSIRLTQRQRWILNNSHQGAVIIDDGAVEALKKHRSLLPSGVTGVSGVFEEGDVIQVLKSDGSLFGKAVSAFDSTAIALMMGKRTGEISPEHRDYCIFRPEDLVVNDDSTL